MKVLVAGATGAIGRPLVSALIAARHEVIGMSSTEQGAQSLREIGVEGAIANALDENAVLTLVRKVGPDAVIEELTSLPKRYTPEEMKAAADRDRTVRLVGGRNVQNAARAVGTKRYIVQSTGFFYGPGPALAVERDALAVCRGLVTLATPCSFINAFFMVTGQVGQVILGTAKVRNLGAAHSGEERANRTVAIAPCSSFTGVLIAYDHSPG